MRARSLRRLCALLVLLLLSGCAHTLAQQDASVVMTDRTGSLEMVSSHRCVYRCRVMNRHPDKTVQSFELSCLLLDSAYHMMGDETVSTVEVTLRPGAERLMPGVGFTAHVKPAYIVWRVLSVRFTDGTLEERPGEYKVLSVR